MELIEIIILALIQGITEFLPISSSAHLIFPSALLGWKDQGLAFDIAVHFGSLLAVVYYLRHDLQLVTAGWTRSIRTRSLDEEGRLAWGLIVATLPAALAGWLFVYFIETHLRSILVIALVTIIFGVLLGIVDARSKRDKHLVEISWGAMLFIGLAQAIALIPGTSRSGITMTAGLMAGLDREASARFSFLMSVPLIALVAIYKTWKMVTAQISVNWTDIFLGTGISAVVAFLCISWFVSFVSRVGFMPFVIYRLVLGMLLLVVYIQVN